MKLHILSEEKESQNIHYYCIATDSHRYDFAIIFSGNFLGKAMVISIQSERMVLICRDDLKNPEHWVQKLGIMPEDIPDLEQFFYGILEQQIFTDQY
ncbi:SAV0927 family protein [Bacillus sp. EAC]|uniref:SAV0927 family protein n=1 Tax=Bacillus sp. EAC TaxID=1978338 RepID=UPI000B430AF8|nr:SAV0927 family protein [Bacillus sp. EAC]